MNKHLRVFTFLLLMLLSACASLVPATSPSQLEASPAAPISITDETVNAGYFSINYPDGWRVVKISIAGEPLRLVFAAPDDTETWIEVAERPIPIPDLTLDPNLYERYETVENGEEFVYFQGRTRIESQENFDAIFETVLNSVIFH